MDDLERELNDAWLAVRERSPKPSAFVAERLRSTPWIRVARSVGGLAIMFPGSQTDSVPDVHLEHLRARFNVQCSIESNGHTEEETLTIVECLASSPDLLRLFLAIAANALPFRQQIGAGELSEAVSTLVELFKSLLEPGTRSIIGLWGELFVIEKATNPGYALDAWHTNPRDRFDFAAGRERVEVKTTTGLRAHHFSLEQILPLLNTRVTVASIVTASSSVGLSIQELIGSIFSRISDEQRRVLVRTAMRSLGQGWLLGTQARFDSDLARRTLSWFDAQVIPRVADPPIDVSRVKFISDLQNTEPLSHHDLANIGPLGEALAPAGWIS